jgi:hypothetical protein
MGEMERLTDLGVALGPRRQPDERLRTRVLAEVAAGTGPQAPRPRWWGRPALIAAAVLTVVGGGLLLGGRLAGPGPVSPGDGASPVPVRPVAFRVQANADGSVAFTAHDLVDTAAATRALNDAGIAGKVLNNDPGCTSRMDPADFYPADTLRGKYPNVGGGATVTVRASDYPAGGGVLVVVGPPARPKSETGEAVGLGVWAYATVNRIPACVNLVDPGTG